MFDDLVIDQMRAIYEGAVKHHERWKQIPASDARLRSMAKVLAREYGRLLGGDEDSNYAQLLGSVRKLTGGESARFNAFFDPLRKKLEDRDEWCQSFKNSFK